METKKNNHPICVYFVLLSLLAAPLAIAGRVEPLFKSHEKLNFLRPNFDRIFDTSKYGILQLNNGLARTPQMGFVFDPHSTPFSRKVLIFGC